MVMEILLVICGFNVDRAVELTLVNANIDIFYKLRDNFLGHSKEKFGNIIQN